MTLSFTTQSIPTLSPMFHLGSQQFQRRVTIPLTRHHLWLIETGMVRTVTWDDDGTVTTLGIWGQGDIVGQSLSAINPYQIECLNVVQASRVSNDCWRHTDVMLAHIQQMETLLKITRCKRVGERLWQLLTWLTQRFGRETDQGLLTDLAMTHQDLAEAIGTSRVTVTRLMNQLEQGGSIRRFRKRYLLLHAVNC